MCSQKLCFVVMGYGVKTDYTTGRQLNLDKTYRNIIKPAIEEVGLKCTRADEIIHSGVIDVPMYKYLIAADIVIADLSTYNTNTFYELGVRHALRPRTTIVIAEKELKKPFDVEHTIIRRYDHLGDGIDYDEVIRFREELKAAIISILERPEIDSPVYTYLAGLRPPIWDGQETIAEKIGDSTLSDIIEKAELAIKDKNFPTAIQLLNTALLLDKNSIFVIQRLTLATYKSEHPSLKDALYKALEILATLEPETSTDPETLGLAAAIYKRLWENGEGEGYIDKAIYYLEKGFYIKNDYYNGINLAFLLNARGFHSLGEEKIADYVLASRIRKRVISICETLIQGDLEGRGDKYWIFATLAEAYYGLGLTKSYEENLQKASYCNPASWQDETTKEQIKKLSAFIVSQ